MHLPALIVDLAVILAVAGVMSFIFHKIMQPVVLGYILAGVIVGPFTPPIMLVQDVAGIQTWADLGVIFLMFTLGLEFSFRKLLKVGMTAGITASVEVLFFLIVGFILGQAFGWTSLEGLFLGAMLSISSTTIIIKALEELKLKSHRFASLIFGILIVEDLLAIILLVALTAVSTSANVSVFTLASTALNLVLVVGGWFITGYFIVPKIMAYVARRGNNEMLTLVATGLCLLLVVLATRLGYSMALGAFIMGSILAETEIIHRIEGLMSPLKDLFGAIFFVSIGMLIDPQVLLAHWDTILILSAVTIVGKFLSTSFGAIISGQSFKNSVQIGLGLAQIGEFSFIIASLGLSLKAIDSKLYPIAVGVSILTTFTTPYLIKYSPKVAAILEGILPSSFRDRLIQYGTWMQSRSPSSTNSKDLQEILFRWVANGIIVTLIYNLNALEVVQKFPVFYQNICWALSIALASPFVWAMVFTNKKHYLRLRKKKNFLHASVLLSLPFLTSIWIGVLCAQDFPLKYVVSIIGVTLIVVYFFLYKQLESYYQWFEHSFLKTFQAENPQKNAHDELIQELAPWDSHLVTIEVHPNAELVNKNLVQASLRKRFGINIVAIQRGLTTLVAPGPQDLILPKDALVVLGTDEQIDALKPLVERPFAVPGYVPVKTNYRLEQLRIRPESTLSGLSIGDSKIRERYHSIVVGIERNGARIVNPGLDFKLLDNDTLWIVGEEQMLRSLATELR